MLEWIQNRIRILRSENVIDLYSNINPFKHVEDVHVLDQNIYAKVEKNSKSSGIKQTTSRQEKNFK
jgi:hypothetical protein|tara:strand:+ start:133 stop:330 length:198 start_codon:yes stop_codon:yes gene_type:complete